VRVAAAILLIACCAAPTFAQSPGDYVVLRGSATIGNVGEHEIAVVVNADARRSPTARHIFRLWSTDAVRPFRTTCSSASVEYRGTELVVLDADQQLFFSLEVTGAARAPQMPAGFTGARYEGYGLNHQILPARTSAGPSLLDCDFDCYTGPDMQDYGTDAAGATSCDAGGPGSTSCSVSGNGGSSCSVTCTGATYACCNYAYLGHLASCKCVKN
jgi:hypothetical protein